jgi:hypothetical protein
MSGGADSHYQPVTTNATNIPSFSITANNTQPVWLYCRQTGYGATSLVPQEVILERERNWGLRQQKWTHTHIRN